MRGRNREGLRLKEEKGIPGDDRLQRGNYPRITEGGINRRGPGIQASPKIAPGASAHPATSARAVLRTVGTSEAGWALNEVFIWNHYRTGKSVPPRWGDVARVPTEPVNGLAAGAGSAEPLRGFRGVLRGMGRSPMQTTRYVPGKGLFAQENRR